MNVQQIVLFILFGAFVIYGIYGLIYCSRSHFKCASKALLKRDAKINDVQTERIGNRATRKFRTIVFFDDQSKFISHKVNIDYGIVNRTISVDAKLRIEILQDAIAAHQRAIDEL